MLNDYMTTHQKLDLIINRLDEIESAIKHQSKDKRIDDVEEWLMRHTKDNPSQIGKGI